MALNLDPATEQRIERQVALRHASGVDEVINEALDLLEEEQEWKVDLNRRLAQGMEQIERGEGIPGDELLQVLAERRKTQHAK